MPTMTIDMDRRKHIKDKYSNLFTKLHLIYEIGIHTRIINGISNLINEYCDANSCYKPSNYWDKVLSH